MEKGFMIICNRCNSKIELKSYRSYSANKEIIIEKSELPEGEILIINCNKCDQRIAIFI